MIERLTTETELAEQFNLPLKKVQELRQTQKWPHVRLTRVRRAVHRGADRADHRAAVDAPGGGCAEFVGCRNTECYEAQPGSAADGVTGGLGTFNLTQVVATEGGPLAQQLTQ